MTSLWLRQVQGILRLELRKNLFSWRAVPIYLLALFPLVVVLLFVIVTTMLGEAPEEFQGPAGAATLFAVMFQVILLLVYIGCVWTFMNLFRGEVLDRSLHYYFLAPIRREVLVAGKYLSAWVGTVLLFGSVTLVCFMIIYGYLGGAGDSLLGPAGHLGAYLAVVGLACLGYGAAFLVVGLVFRNPIIPALGFLLWESINSFLPGLLKKISVIFYLQALFPVSIGEGAVAFIVEPVSPWLSVPGLFLFTAATLFVATLRIRRMEISYASD